MFYDLIQPIPAVILAAGIFVAGVNMRAQDQPTSVFGQSTQSEAALMGVFYDLKQTQDHKSTNVDPDGYSKIIDEFISKGWDESVLNRYYQVSKPLFTTQIFIPIMNADDGPKAFGAEKTVQPSRWVIHYKGQVSPPESGTYRFWGRADDVLIVGVNRKTVLVGCFPGIELPKTNWKPSGPDGAKASDVDLRPGDWIDLKANEIVDFDVLIGERPGGLFNAFLLLEKKGENYAKDTSQLGQGNPIFPIFQVAPYDTPVIDNLDIEPKFAKGFPTWKSYQ